jgi:hypothetical protein
MAITLPDEGSRAGAPVVKAQRFGEVARLALIRAEQRGRRKRDQATGADVPLLKPDGRQAQELVIHAIVMPGTTAAAGIRDEVAVPNPGDRVRLILKGKSFGQWIEAKKNHRGGKLQVGDVITRTIDNAQAYDANGAPKGQPLRSQAEADALHRGVTVGFYGPLTIAAATAADQQWVAAAEAAYMADQAIELPEESAGADDDF